MTRKLDGVKYQIIKALRHPEAQDGLFFRNFYDLHEEDERQIVDADQAQILAALNELVLEGDVRLEGNGEDIIYQLTRDFMR